MIVDLNGIDYVVNVYAMDNESGVRAEIVDEAFNFNVECAGVFDVQDIARLIHRYSDVPPSAALLSEISRQTSELFQDQRLLCCPNEKGPVTGGKSTAV